MPRRRDPYSLRNIAALAGAGFLLATAALYRSIKEPRGLSPQGHPPSHDPPVTTKFDADPPNPRLEPQSLPANTDMVWFVAPDIQPPHDEIEACKKAGYSCALIFPATEKSFDSLPANVTIGPQTQVFLHSHGMVSGDGQHYSQFSDIPGQIIPTTSLLRNLGQLAEGRLIGAIHGRSCRTGAVDPTVVHHETNLFMHGSDRDNTLGKLDINRTADMLRCPYAAFAVTIIHYAEMAETHTVGGKNFTVSLLQAPVGDTNSTKHFLQTTLGNYSQFLQSLPNPPGQDAIDRVTTIAANITDADAQGYTEEAFRRIVENTRDKNPTSQEEEYKRGLSTIEAYLKQHPDLMYKRMSHNITPIDVAVGAPDPRILELFLNAGLDPNYREEDKLPLLNLAIMAKAYDSARMLLQRGANISVVNHSGGTLLHERVFLKDREGVQLLLEYGADVSARANDGATPLHIAAYNGDVECSAILLRYCASPNTPNINGETPLAFAAREGHEELVKRYLTWGADPALAVPDGKSFLFSFHVRNKSPQIADILETFKASPPLPRPWCFKASRPPISSNPAPVTSRT